MMHQRVGTLPRCTCGEPMRRTVGGWFVCHNRRDHGGLFRGPKDTARWYPAFMLDDAI